MSLSVARSKALLRRHSRLATGVVLLLAALAILPALHTLLPHHGDGGHDRCPICLLAVVGWFALLAGFVFDLPPNRLAAVFPAGRRPPRRSRVSPDAARAPPLPD